MKRTFALIAMLALLVVGAVAPAQASVTWTSKLIPIRKQQAALVGGYIDSTFTSHTGAVTDTTAPFVLEGRTAAWSNVDTSLVMVVTQSITSNSTTTAAGSTCTITLQGSNDGINWTGSPAYVASELVNGAGLVLMKPYSMNNSFPVFAALTDNNMGYFSMYRIIFANASGQVGTLGHRVSYWKTTDQLNW